MQDNEALAFYDRIVEGKDDTDTITLEHHSGQTLENVRMTTVDKQVLGSVIERLPQEMFEAVEETEDYDDAEEQLEDQGMGTEAVTEQTIAAFEDLCAESLQHDDLTPSHMESIVEELDFELLFSLGAEIIERSFEQSGAIKDFHEQQ